MARTTGNHSYDVAVVGGGVIGLAIAWRATTAGLRTCVIDDAPGRGASWAAAGMLAPVTEAHYGEEALLRLNLAAAERYASFAGELVELTGTDIGYRRTGTLAVARDRDDDEALDQLFRYQRELGLPSERLRGRACRALEPSLAPRVRSGILVPDDHQVDNRALVDALQRACERSGVGLLRDRAMQLETAAGHTTGVTLLQAGPVTANQVVLAGGAASSQLHGLVPEVVPPVRPVKGQLLHLRGPADPPLLSHNLRGLDVYLVPRADGRLVVGATVEDQGFDRRVTAGGVFELLRDAYELLPGITELELTETVCGLRPGSPDNAPLLGATELEGLVLATGHYRNGVLLAPVTADAVAHLLVTGETPDLIAPFSPRRFDVAVDPAELTEARGAT